MKPNTLENHICGNNDGECKCVCFIQGVIAGLKEQVGVVEAIREYVCSPDEYRAEHILSQLKIIEQWEELLNIK